MSRKLKWILLFVTFCAFVLTWKMLPSEAIHDHGGNSDEYFYLSYAKHISEAGLPGFKHLINWYSEDEINRYHPSPLRAGYILISVLFIKLFGTTFSSLVILSYLCFLLSCWIFYYLAKKNFSQEIAIFFLFLLSSSPLMLGMSRVALSDSLINLLLGTSAWLFLDFLQRPTRKTLIILTTVLFFGLLVKETTCLFIVFILIFSAIASKKLGIKIAAKDLLVLTIIPPILAGLFYICLLGPSTFSTGLHSIYLTHFVDQANRYAIDFSSGPWYRYLIDFMAISPVMTTIAIGYGFYIIFEKGRDWKEKYFLLYFIATFIPLSMLQHSKVVRFVINLEMVIALFCALAAVKIYEEDIKKKNFIKVIVLLTVIFLFSYRQFYTIFVDPLLLDPITYNIMQIKKFIP